MSQEEAATRPLAGTPAAQVVAEEPGAPPEGAAGAPPLLEVRDLRLAYATERGPLRAVDGISLDLAEGEALGIIGESGSGKTSLALALMRLLPRNATLESGTMRLAGEDLGSLSVEAFRQRVRWSRMAMVFQGAMHSLNPVVRVADQVGERLRADGLPRREVEARVSGLLGRVGLPAGTGRRYPHELSGGMKQRVMIAAALTHDPPLLILDEPTSALDVSIQAQIMNLLKELKSERRMAMLFVTHDLALASDLCDHIAVVYAGQVREHGSAEEVLRRPLDPYTQGLLASIPSLHEERPPRFLPGAPPDLRAGAARLSLRAALPARLRGLPGRGAKAACGRWLPWRGRERRSRRARGALPAPRPGPCRGSGASHRGTRVPGGRHPDGRHPGDRRRISPADRPASGGRAVPTARGRPAPERGGAQRHLRRAHVALREPARRRRPGGQPGHRAWRDRGPRGRVGQRQDDAGARHAAPGRAQRGPSALRGPRPGEPRGSRAAGLPAARAGHLPGLLRQPQSLHARR